MTLKDRRRATRFEFVEDQWGSIHALEPLRLRNFARDGAQIESATPLSVGSVHIIQLAHSANTAQCQAVVRHVSPGDQADHETDGQPFVIGLEFIHLDDHAKRLIQQILADPGDPADPTASIEA